MLVAGMRRPQRADRGSHRGRTLTASMLILDHQTLIAPT